MYVAVQVQYMSIYCTVPTVDSCNRSISARSCHTQAPPSPYHACHQGRRHAFARSDDCSVLYVHQKAASTHVGADQTTVYGCYGASTLTATATTTKAIDARWVKMRRLSAPARHKSATEQHQRRALCRSIKKIARYTQNCAATQPLCAPAPANAPRGLLERGLTGGHHSFSQSFSSIE